MCSVCGNPSTSEVLVLVNQETFKVKQNKRALLVTKPEKKKKRMKEKTLYKNAILFIIELFFFLSREYLRTHSTSSISFYISNHPRITLIKI